MYSRERSVRALGDFLGHQAPSLRSVEFNGIFPILGSFFPLPSLTELYLRLPGGMDPFRISSLFRLFSSCPRLQTARINVQCTLSQDIVLGQVILLDSLVELEYTCNNFGRFIPFLRLPRLKRLRIFLGKVEKLADLLPHNGHNLLSGATTMSHFYDGGSQAVELSGNGVDASFGAFENAMGTTSAGWFSDDTYIPFGQIGDLEFGGYHISADFPFHLFKKLTTFRVIPKSEPIAAVVFGLLRPRPGAGIPCPSLRGITYTFSKPTEWYMRPLIGLARERERAGYQLELVCVLVTLRPDPDLEEELREHVGELQVGIPEEVDRAPLYMAALDVYKYKRMSVALQGNCCVEAHITPQKNRQVTPF
jgi:hypothetical protein